MATYTIPNLTFSASQEMAVDMQLKLTNNARAAQTPPLTPITKTQLIQGYVASIPAQWLNEFRYDAKNRLSVAVETMPDATLVNVMAAAGVDLNPYD